MKKHSLWFAASAILLLSALTACDNPAVPPAVTVTLTAETGGLNGEGVFDFGVIEAEAGTSAATVTVTNTSETAVTVASVALSDEVNYSLTLPELPGTIAPAESASYTLVFAPAGSGEKTAAITITIQDIAEPSVVNVTGSGNYAPVPRFGITVSGAGTEGANGFYVRDGFQTVSPTTRAKYVKTGTNTYYSFIFPGDGAVWCIADTLNVDFSNPPLYENWSIYPTMPLAPTASGWSGSGTTPYPTVTWQDISGADDYTGVVLTANYLYFDEEGDLEADNSAAYQWYRSDAENGTYAPITGATSKTYTTAAADELKYLKAGITVTAQSGITVGAEVLSSPTVQILPPA